MKITILTLFPEMFESFLNNSIIKRAIARNLVEFELVNIRDFTKNKNYRVDDYPTGGGAGLIMQCQPVIDALKSVKTPTSKSIITSPRGKSFNQQKALELSKEEHLIFVCGHYEGIDERVNKYIDEMISIGDYILTGGEVPVMAMSDAIIRLIKGVISEESIVDESFNNGLLEYPQYTFPYDYEGDTIPDILFSGNHEAIAKYRKKQSLVLTREYRKDLFDNYPLSKQDKKLIEEVDQGITPKWETDAIEKGKKFKKSK
ncbi:MAG: tRNA (guanosine(37)-N1)-methyltransferase TrmD [Bacillales bacterium]|nr:tRNA (guanosine(37)-N1)-methyltransferase TrmD [Bacillales bacterium]